MRILSTAIVSFILSLLVGGMVAVGIAGLVNAREEFILVFMFIPVVALVGGVFFAVAQGRPEPLAAIARIGRWLIGALVIFAMALLAFSIWDARGVQGLRRDLPILIGLVAPAFLVIATQWLFVRWRSA